MARQKTRPTEGPSLYDIQDRTIERRVRRQHALFIPRLLTESAASFQPLIEIKDRAYEAVLRWAELETSGKLAGHRETSIDTQFLDQIFGEGLGYALKTESPAAWHLEHKYPVAGVGIADAALGNFPADRQPTVLVELKDSNTDLDRDRFNGRTAVAQCWDYLSAVPEASWGIVSNFSTIRLYHRSKGSLTYEEFTLQELRQRDRFDEFYFLLERGGLLPSRMMQKPRAVALLEKTLARQKEVGDDLYKSYQLQRLLLIEHLQEMKGKPLDDAIAIAQKLMDRVIFIAFCEDRGLLPENSLASAYSELPPFSRVTNPRWKNFLDLFAAVNEGSNGKKPIPAFNGGLFKHDPEVDKLNLPDEPWTTRFKGFGDYDFSEEVNVEVLGHLFERSITELEKLRVGGWFALKGGVEGANGNGNGGGGGAPRKTAKGRLKRTGGDEADSTVGRMTKSAKRKRFGIYYTPPAFTGLIVQRTVDALVKERFDALAAEYGVDPEARENQNSVRMLAYWTSCLDALKALTVCDPACGSGAFLIRAYESLDAWYKIVVRAMAGAGMPKEEADALESTIPDLILTHNLYGVDLSREGVEITQLALWIRSARKGKTLTDLSKHIVHGNSLVSDPSVDPNALDWNKAFPHVFPYRDREGAGSPAFPYRDRKGAGSPAFPYRDRKGAGSQGGFDCVIGNPPWERVKLQEREFFSLTDPQTAEAVNAADRKKRIEAMPEENPGLHAAYEVAQASAARMLDHARNSGQYPLTGKGDINLYMLFAERAKQLVAPDGRVGLLVPSGIATDDTTKEFFNNLMDRKALVCLYDFENRIGHFPDVDGRFKFSALVFGGGAKETPQADFVFFARDIEDIAEQNKQRHIPLTAADMKLLNPNTRTCPIFRTRRDADLTRAIYKRVPILIDENRKRGGNPWGIKFLRMFDQTNDAEHFKPAKVWEKKGYKLDGNVYVKGKKRALPLYEAKMVQAYDHRAASVVIETENWMRQGQKVESYETQHANPEYAVLPRWWVDAGVLDETESLANREWLLTYKDVTSPTNERTMIGAFLPRVAVANSAPIMFPGENVPPRLEACLLANLNSFVYDFVSRQKVGGVHLNFFIVEQLPTFPPDRYADPCPWSKRETLEHWISERVLKLSCTAEDMIPLANACDFKGSRGDGVHIWKERERAEIRAELDAAYFHLYGLERDDVEYILSTFTNTGYISPEQRGQNGGAWQHGGVGEITLEAYDALKKAQS